MQELISTTEKLQRQVVVAVITTITPILPAAAVSLEEVIIILMVETEQTAAVHGATIPVQPAIAGRSIRAAVQAIVLRLVAVAALPLLQVKAVEAHLAAVVINS